MPAAAEARKPWRREGKNERRHERDDNAPTHGDGGVDWRGLVPRSLHHSICRSPPAPPWPDADEDE